MRLLLSLAIGFGLVWGGPTKASARPTTATKRRVAKHKRAAFRLFEQKRWSEGIAEMEAAHALLPHPGFLLNVAVAYHRWGGHCEEALERFDAFFESCPDCALRQAARERRVEIVEACEVPVSVRTEPPGGRLELDGAPVGIAPTALRLLPGAYRLTARLDGHTPAERGFEVRDGVGPSLVLPLVPLTPAVPAAPSPPGPLEGGAPVVRAPPPPPDKSVSAGPWVAAGVGVVGVASGAALTVHTMSIVDAEAVARAEGRDRATIEALRSDAETAAIGAHVGYGVGLAGLVVGLVWALTDDGGGDPPAVSMRPSAGGARAEVRF